MFSYTLRRIEPLVEKEDYDCSGSHVLTASRAVLLAATLSAASYLQFGHCIQKPVPPLGESFLLL
jgi:hypothetical protein